MLVALKQTTTQTRDLTWQMFTVACVWMLMMKIDEPGPVVVSVLQNPGLSGEPPSTGALVDHQVITPLSLKKMGCIVIQHSANDGATDLCGRRKRMTARRRERLSHR